MCDVGAGTLAAILGLPTTQARMRHLALTLNIMGAPGRFYARGDDVRISVHFNPPWGLGHRLRVG